MNTFFTTETLIECTYLVATALFILSLKWLSSPVTARRGLFAGEAGMVLAIGGLCVTVVGTAEFYLRAPDISPFMMAVLSMEVILGSLTFTGSLMAAGKLQEVLPQRPLTYKGQNLVNFLLLLIAVALAVYLVLHPEAKQLYPFMLLI